MSICIEALDHIGIRVSEEERAIQFYAKLGFEPIRYVEHDALVILKNQAGHEINLIVNADTELDRNQLMDVPEKYAGYTHIGWRTASMLQTLQDLREQDISITQGPVQFGDAPGVSVFIRDPDYNVIELRAYGDDPEKIEGLTSYQPS